MTSPAIRFRVDFHDRCSVGIGKVRLLEEIERTGSLSQAARDMAMSYRRAWLLIHSLNAGFDAPVVRATVGGRSGGGAKLTPFGRQLIEAYRKLESRLTLLAADYMRGIAAHAARHRRVSVAGGTRPRKSIARSLKRASR